VIAAPEPWWGRWLKMLKEVPVGAPLHATAPRRLTTLAQTRKRQRHFLRNLCMYFLLGKQEGPIWGEYNMEEGIS
jgi:hypothetical protein